jgi:RimJ/RimL family protein N-acetyltransferase
LGATAEVRALLPDDAERVCALLRTDPPAYWRHFARFHAAYARAPERLAGAIASARRDRYWGLVSGPALAGFFMLRGFDEGFDRPAFGVYVGAPYAGQGLAKQALDHALRWCEANGVARVMLKVAAANERAYSAYLSAGFRFERKDTETGQDILEWRNGQGG